YSLWEKQESFRESGLNDDIVRRVAAPADFCVFLHRGKVIKTSGKVAKRQSERQGTKAQRGKVKSI
ncbi:MAG: hypothetical protein U9N45_00190, partial [Gemmatimonadota bacterium]|nr:hypothetical protein [Gemmatimonadota bacterium]